MSTEAEPPVDLTNSPEDYGNYLGRGFPGAPPHASTYCGPNGMWTVACGDMRFMGDENLMAYYYGQAMREICRLRVSASRLPRCWRLDEFGELKRDYPVAPGMKLYLRDHPGAPKVVDAVRSNSVEFVGYSLCFDADACFVSREAIEVWRRKAKKL